MSKRRDAQRYRKSYSYFRPAPRLADTGGGADQAYVDNAIWSIDWKQSVRAASTPGLNVSLTGGPYTIDGVTLSDGDRVLLKDQTDPSENGIYVYSASTLLLVRDHDALQGTLTSGAACFVEKGTINTETMWVLTTHDPITVGTTPLNWMEFFPFGNNHSIFTETSPVYAKTTSSVSFDSSFRNPNQIGSDVFFFVSGSLDGSGKSVFGGDVRISGSLALGTGSAYLRVQDHGDIVLSPHKEYIYAGPDVFFFVSGSPGDNNKSLFGGDVVVSGSLTAANLTGSLTRLSNGDPYLVAARGISILTSSNGSIVLSTTDTVRMGAIPLESTDGSRTVFTVPAGDLYRHIQDVSTISVYLNGVRQIEGLGNDFLATETSPGSGMYNQVTFVTAPVNTDIVMFDYVKVN